jgi:hypothetical protein
MSYALEFYSLSWDTLKSTLGQPTAEFLRAIEEQQWPRLLEDTDLGQPTHHLFPYPHEEPSPFSANAGPLIGEGLAEIAQAMAQTPSLAHDPPEISDKAALVFAAAVRQLGKPLGAIRHLGAAAASGGLALDFREMFLDGVAGTCFGDHRLGENLAARPLFGVFHLDFLAWGGLTQKELSELLAKFELPEAEKRDEEWQAIADHAEAWLADLLAALRAAAAAKTDLVTLYLTVQKRHTTIWEDHDDEFHEDLVER